MPLSPEEWHNRFTRQARWTKDLRNYLYRKTKINLATRMLDIGSGTGALSSDFQQQPSVQIYSLDINYAYLSFTRGHTQIARLVQGDAHYLPYQEDTFDITLCHFLLMWVERPDDVVAEMKRVTRAGGSVLAFAEPDYSGRIDYPDELSQLGEWQKLSLIEQGADPIIGRRLAELFVDNGLMLVEVGVLGGQWDKTGQIEESQSEADMVFHDLEFITTGSNDQLLFENLISVDKKSRKRGVRILFVPTFYAWGRVMK
jgi:SAM-dependent methyltransferase